MPVACAGLVRACGEKAVSVSVRTLRVVVLMI